MIQRNKEYCSKQNTRVHEIKDYKDTLDTLNSKILFSLFELNVETILNITHRKERIFVQKSILTLVYKNKK